MSKQIVSQDGVTITQYTAPTYPDGKGYQVRYQVTWGLDKYVCFDSLHHAQQFMYLIRKAITEK